MQKMLTSVEAWPAPSLRVPAGAPVSVIVRAPPPAGPKAPGLRCWQSGHEPLPSVQAVGKPLPMKHGLGAVWSQLPAPTPVQQLNGLPAPMHPLLAGHPGAESPSKQPVPAAVMSRQKRSRRIRSTGR